MAEKKGRVVKLQDTGEKGNSLSAYKGEDGKYYSSEGAFNQKVRMANYRKKCISEMYYLLEYDTYMKVPGVFWKWLNEVEPYGYDTVLLCMEKCADAISWALKNKQFTSESGKMMYIIAIFNNNITDALKETVAKRKQRQKKIDEVMVESLSSLDINTTKQKSKNIAKYLEEDDF